MSDQVSIMHLTKEQREILGFLPGKDYYPRHILNLKKLEIEWCLSKINELL